MIAFAQTLYIWELCYVIKKGLLKKKLVFQQSYFKSPQMIHSSTHYDINCRLSCTCWHCHIVCSPCCFSSAAVSQPAEIGCQAVVRWCGLLVLFNAELGKQLCVGHCDWLVLYGAVIGHRRLGFWLVPRNQTWTSMDCYGFCLNSDLTSLSKFDLLEIEFYFFTSVYVSQILR